MTHAFVIPVFGKPAHLPECLRSLAAQTKASPVTMVTSTPSRWLTGIAEEFGVRLVEHGPPRGIAHDWNHALAQGDADWITIAHQDDVYHPRFAQATLEALARHEDALLAFTDYEELTPAGPRRATTLLRIKRCLLEFGFLGRNAVRSQWLRTNALRFGSPIPCPAVTLRRDLGLQFDAGYGVNMDWAAWLGLCNRPGSFVWVREVLMSHRIHPDSETSHAIAAGRRASEDERLLRQLWPGWIARMIVRSYRLAYASNKT